MKLSKYFFIATLTILPFGFAINPTSGIDLNIIRIIIPLLFLVWLGESLFNKKIYIDTRPRFFFLMLFLMLILFSFFWAQEKQRALRKILFIFSIIPIYLVSFDLFKKKLSKDLVLKIILITSLIQSIIGIFQFLLQFVIGIDPSLKIWRLFSSFSLGKTFSETVHQYSSWLVNLNGATVLRAFGTFPDPHLFSLFISLSLPISWYFFQKNKKSVYLFLGAIQLLAIAFSFSRSSYLAIATLLIGFLLVKIISALKNRKFNYFQLIVILILLIIIITPNPLSQRFKSSFNPTEGSNQGRIEMWEKSLKTIQLHPAKGIGIGNFSYFVKPSSQLREPIYAHNLFLDFGSETGLPSLVLLLLIFSSPVLTFLINKKGYNIALQIPIVLFFVVFFIFSLFETPFYSINIFPLFLIFLAIPYEKK